MTLSHPWKPTNLQGDDKKLTTMARPVLYTPACFMTQSEDFIMHFVFPSKETNFHY